MKLSGVLLLALLTLSSCQEEKPFQPNILFLFADDQRADTIRGWGNQHISTPNLDRLVERGFSFRSNYNLGGNSGAVCVPSRAMVNTGLAYFRLQNDLEGTTTVPQTLRQNGYTTFATGKWHNEEASWLRSFGEGKNVFFGGMSDHTQVPLRDLSSRGALTDERIGNGFSSRLFADATVEFLETYRSEKPFYAYVAFTAPHDPRQPPDDFRQHYYNSPPPLPRNFMAQHPFNLGDWLTVRDEVLASWPRKEEIIRVQLAEYYGMITHLDGEIGRILTQLEKSGFMDSTVIVYAADHGLALGSHGLLGKQNLYEHSQKCPLIISGPGIPSGQTTALTYLLDVPATLLSLAGIPPPGTLDGKDLSRIWKGEEKVRNSLFLAFTDQSRSVRDERYKLILYPQINFIQLFDLQSDPDELVNLAGEGSHTQHVERLRALLQDWQVALGDQQPLSVQAPFTFEVDLSGFERIPDRWQPEWIVDKYFD